jgi:hypothetical protein
MAAVPCSTTSKVPRQSSSHPTAATASAHHRIPIPVTSWSARQIPPISDAITSRLTTSIAISGAMKKRTPNRSRNWSTNVRRLTAARRPLISIRKASPTVPTTSTHASCTPNSAPACAVVAIEPISRNPPMPVTRPSATSAHFFMSERPWVAAATAREGRLGKPRTLARREIRTVQNCVFDVRNRTEYQVPEDLARSTEAFNLNTSKRHRRIQPSTPLRAVTHPH